MLKNLKYLSLLSILILPFLIQDADALISYDIVNATESDTVHSVFGVNKADGGTWTFDNKTPPAVSDTEGVYFVWQEGTDEAGTDPFELWYGTTTDGAIITRTQVDTINTSGFEYQYEFMKIEKSSDDTLHIWFQEQTGATDTSTFYTQSTNDGATWSSAVLVNGTTNSITSFKTFSESENVIYFLGHYTDDATNPPSADNQLYLIKSIDGGGTWTSTLATDGTGVIHDAVTDSSGRFDLAINSNNLYVVYDAFESVSTDNFIYYVKSSNGGTTFTTPIVFGDGDDYNNASPVRILINSNDTTEIISVFGQTGSGNLVLERSTDTGATFGTVETIINETNYDDQCDIEQLTISGSDDSLYLLCEDGNQELNFFSSADFGSTWSAEIDVVDVPVVTQTPFAIEVTTYDGVIIYACFWQLDVGNTENYCIESTDSGATWNSFVQDITMANADNTRFNKIAGFVPIKPSENGSQPLFDYFMADHDGTGIFTSEHNISLGVGTPTTFATTFDAFVDISQSPTEPSEVYRNSNGRNELGGQSYQFIEGNKVHFIYHDENTSNEFELMYNVYDTDSEIMGTPVEIDEVTNGFNYEYWQKAISASGSTIDVIFNEEIGNSATELFHSRSTDFGATWSTPVNVFAGNSQWIGFFVNGNTIDVFYDDSDNNIEFHTRSTNGGTSFNTPVQVSTPPVATSNDFYENIQQTSADEFHVLYRGESTVGSVNNIYYTNSTDGGQTWSDEVDFTGAVGNEDAFGANLFIDDNDSTHYLIFYGFLNQVAGDNFLYQIESNDSGTTWSTPEIRTDINDDECNGVNVASTSSSVEGSNHLITRDGDNIFFACLDGFNLLKYDYSKDFGATWQDLQDFNENLGIDDQTFGQVQAKLYGDNLYLMFEVQTNLGVDTLFFMESNNVGTTFAVGATRVEFDAFPADTFIESWSYPFQFDNGLIGFSANDQQSGTFEFDLVLFIEGMVTNSSPVITVNGVNPQNISLDSSYVELGASCTDAEDGSITVDIDSSAVNTSIVGSYIVTYDCQDSAGANAIQLTRTVNVNDTESPVITLLGDNPQVVIKDGTYLEAGATCLDGQDGQIDGNVVIDSSAVDTSTIGTYDVTYDCQDSQSNNAIQVIREVEIANAGGGATTGGTGDVGVSNTIGETGGTEGIPEALQALFDQQIEDLLNSIPPTQASTIQSLVQTFFEFQVLDTELDSLTLQSFVQSQALPIRWSSGDDIVITEIRDAPSPFIFTFETLPVQKSGSGGVITNNNLIYAVEVPRNECSSLVSTNCVEKLRYEVPITVNAVINNTAVLATGNITIDLTEEIINPVIIIMVALALIPIVAGIAWKLKGGKNPSNVREIIG